MQQNRYNSFNQIHKGLRALLFETATDLQRADLSDAEEGRQAIDQLTEVMMLFESHAHGEDHFFNTPLEQKESGMAELFIKEHEEDHRLAQVLENLIDQWKQETSCEGRALVGRNLLYAYYEFIAFNLYHMNKEEIELNANLWKHYTDAEIKSIEQTLVNQIPPQKMAAYARWMIRGINDQELFKWLNEVRHFAPKEVFSMLTSIARENLNGYRFQSLQEKLNEQMIQSSV